MHLGQGDHDQAWSGCCQDSWIYVLWRVPLLAKEMCDARTIDHSKTLSQEGCPSLSSGAVGLDRSPTHSWSLATSQLCGWEHVLHPLGLPRRLEEWDAPVGICAQRPGSLIAHSLLPLLGQHTNLFHLLLPSCLYKTVFAPPPPTCSLPSSFPWMLLGSSRVLSLM